MRSTVPMRVAKLGTLLGSLLLSALGVFLLAEPTLSVNVLGRIGGVVLLICGGFRIVGFFSGDLFRLAFQYDLASGLLLLLCGAALLLRPVPAFATVCVAAGVLVLADGLLKLQISLEGRRFGLRHWWVILALALLTGVLGFLLVLHPVTGVRAAAIMLGLTLLAEGILTFCTMLSAVKIIRYQKCDTPIKSGKD